MYCGAILPANKPTFFYMATLKLYLDIRNRKRNGTYPLRISLTHRSSTAYINTGIDLELDQWDSVKLKVKKHPQKIMLNQLIQQRLGNVQIELLKIVDSGEARGLNASALKRAVVCALDPDTAQVPTLMQFLDKVIKSKKAVSTQNTFSSLKKKIKALRSNADRLRFEDISVNWLTQLDKDMEADGLSLNSRTLYFCKLATAFNAAIDEGLTNNYPFRKFRLKREETKKRALSIDLLRKLWLCKPDGIVAEYLDIFRLTFYLIGINMVDLLNLKASDYRNGRITYYRAKTGRLYDIKVEPEAAAIIERYKGNEGVFLLRMMERTKKYTNYYDKMNDALKLIVIEGSPNGYISTYYARHSWATIAASLDIPKETIAAALGHGSKTVTDIYIDFDQKKVDAANRKVIDYVLEVQNI